MVVAIGILAIAILVVARVLVSRAAHRSACCNDLAG